MADIKLDLDGALFHAADHVSRAQSGLITSQTKLIHITAAIRFLEGAESMAHQQSAYEAKLASVGTKHA